MVELKGKIISGLKKAAFFVQLDWVQEQCNAKLGFYPYPGTLNIEVSSEDFPIIDLGAWNDDPIVIQAIKEKIDTFME